MIKEKQVSSVSFRAGERHVRLPSPDRVLRCNLIETESNKRSEIPICFHTGHVSIARYTLRRTNFCHFEVLGMTDIGGLIVPI